MNIALVLSGGGARGAYQVGALHALSDLVKSGAGERALPFPILAGASAGAITTSFLAARADDFSFAVHRLVNFWSTLEPHDVFRTDLPTLARVCLKWLTDLSLGGLIGRHREKALLVSDPLRKVLEVRLDMDAVHDNIERGAIPIFFPAIRLEDGYYADGCLRSSSPLSPAIHPIPLCVLRPSQDLGVLAKDTLGSLPGMIQYLFRGLGVSGRSGWDLLSYLAFERTYTAKLLSLGYADVMAQADALLDFVAPAVRDYVSATRSRAA